MCLARPTPHTGSSGAHGRRSGMHSHTTSAPHPKGGGPELEVRGGTEPIEIELGEFRPPNEFREGVAGFAPLEGVAERALRPLAQKSN